MSKARYFTSVAPAALAVALTVAPAAAADLYYKAPPAPVVEPASMWDIAFGAAIMNDYVFRGISQSDRGPSIGGYFEPQFKITENLEFYLGLGGISVKLPNTPTAEINFYGGFRTNFFGFTADIGALYYYYPKETLFGTAIATDTDFVEVYGKFGYSFNDYFEVGASVYYSPDVLRLGEHGTFVSGNAKLTAPSGMFFGPDIGVYVSGEVGHYFFSGATTDYTTWNAGGGFTYKAMTLDLRYHDTDLSRVQCQAITGDPWAPQRGQNSRWCGAAFVAKLSVDTTLNAIR